jgi:hypothetical protein
MAIPRGFSFRIQMIWTGRMRILMEGRRGAYRDSPRLWQLIFMMRGEPKTKSAVLLIMAIAAK